MKKLTLSADEDVIAAAKKIARSQGTSVSGMFERYIRSLSRKPGEKAPAIGPLTRRATGLIKLPRGKSYKQILSDALAEKYKL